MNIIVEPEFIQYAQPIHDSELNDLPISTPTQMPTECQIDEIIESYPTVHIRRNRIKNRYNNMCKTVCIVTIAFMIASIIIRNINS